MMMSEIAKYLDEIDRLRDALKFYADPKTYERDYLGFKPGFGELHRPSPITDDLFGKRARDALHYGPAVTSDVSDMTKNGKSK